MLITPPVIALAAAGPSLLGIVTILGWFTAYSVRGPFEVLNGCGASGRAGMPRSTPEVARFWLLVLGAAALLLLLPVVLIQPMSLALLGLSALLLGLLHMLAARGQTRSVGAGLLGAFGLMAGAPLYYLAATGQVGSEGWVVALACGAFFAGSVFRVKALVRERGSSSFRLLSVLLHLGALLLAVLAARSGFAPVLLPAAMAMPAGWALYGALRRGPVQNLMRIGKGEQWLTISFGLVLILVFWV